MAEREGFEPFCRLEVKSLENADLFEGKWTGTGE
jgi:hypothetical protein